MGLGLGRRGVHAAAGIVDHLVSRRGDRIFFGNASRIVPCAFHTHRIGTGIFAFGVGPGQRVIRVFRQRIACGVGHGDGRLLHAAVAGLAGPAQRCGGDGMVRGAGLRDGILLRMLAVQRGVNRIGVLRHGGGVEFLRDGGVRIGHLIRVDGADEPGLRGIAAFAPHEGIELIIVRGGDGDPVLYRRGAVLNGHVVRAVHNGGIRRIISVFGRKGNHAVVLTACREHGFLRYVPKSRVALL